MNLCPSPAKAGAQLRCLRLSGQVRHCLGPRDWVPALAGEAHRVREGRV